MTTCRHRLAIAAAFFAAAFSLKAQTPPSSGTQKVDDDGTITLSPFEVKADASDTYDATNTNSVTGTNTSLNKTPLDAKVFNRQMMDELGVVDLSQMLSEVAGLGAAYIGLGGEGMTGIVEGDRLDYKSMSSRGLQISNPRRDGFLRSETSMMDSFDTERVEAMGGSNSLLFGSGDAGGVISVSSKRGLFNRKSLKFSATADRWGSSRASMDANLGYKKFAFRLNTTKGNTYYSRPIKGQFNEGLQLAVAVQPFKRVRVFADYRHYERDSLFSASATVRANPATLMSDGRTLDNKSARLILAIPGGEQLLGGAINLENSESLLGVYRRDFYVNESKSITAEVNIAKGLDVQVRYGHDARLNRALYPSNGTVYAPDSPLNQYVDENGVKQWAIFTNQYQGSGTSGSYGTGARGYRVAAVYRFSSKYLGEHGINVFKQDMWSWTVSNPGRYYEADGAGNIIQDMTKIQASEAGRIAMPAVWQPMMSGTLIGDAKWPQRTVVHPNGKTYVWADQFIQGAVPATAANPLGLSGPVNATTGVASGSTSEFTDDVRERALGFSTFSSLWHGHIDTMFGMRTENAVTFRTSTGISRGPIDYDGTTAGVVFDTGITGVRGYVNYSTNGKMNFDTSRDIYNNTLPAGKGESKEVGLKFSAFNHRISGNINYYNSEAHNFTTTLGGYTNMVNPYGINGRQGGTSYLYSKSSKGYGINLSTQPTKNWELRISINTANGAERSDVILPTFYNDEFNTMTYNGETVVAVKDATSGQLSPLMVPSDPKVATSTPIPLSIAMMKDPVGLYFAQLEPYGGYIINSQALKLTTPGVGTGRVGLPITDHQLGYVSPSNGIIIVRKAGEKTFGYPEQNYNLINRYKFTKGLLNGLVVGMSATYQRKQRAYMYTDAAAGSVRKMFFLPDRHLYNPYAIYYFKAAHRYPMSIQVNVSNALNSQTVFNMVAGSNGTVSNATFLYTPRNISVTTSITF